MVHFEKPCYHLLLLVVFFLILLPSSLATREEGEALVKWKNSLSSSSVLDSWSLANLNNLCNWSGITCNSAASVSEIDLSRKQLEGTLAEFRFISFPSLNKFTIRGNNLKITGELRSLALLNLSHNSLTGSIPSLLGNMETLQSLDLSSNQLTGAIPEQLTSLTFLGALNLSENHLTGEIPQKGQFSTFGNDSYLGNSALCGLPLTKKCVQTVSPPREVEKSDDDAYGGLSWEVILMGYGRGLICGLSLGYIVFKTGKPWWFVRYIEGLQLKLMRTCTKKTVRSRRKHEEIVVLG